MKCKICSNDLIKDSNCHDCNQDDICTNICLYCPTCKAINYCE